MIKATNIFLIIVLTFTFVKPCSDLEIKNICDDSDYSSIVIKENIDNCKEDCCENTCLCFCCNFNFVTKIYKHPERFVKNKELLFQTSSNYIYDHLLSVWQPPQFC